MANHDQPHGPEQEHEQIEAALRYGDKPSAWRVGTLGGLTLAALVGAALQVRGPIMDTVNRFRFGSELRTFKPEPRTPEKVAELIREAAGHGVCANSGNVVFHEPSQNVICGGAAEGLDDDALVEFDHCGEEGLVLSRRQAIAYLLASADALSDTGKCIRLGSTWRSNEGQERAKKKNKFLWWETGAAADKFGGYHLGGRAIDVNGYETEEKKIKVKDPKTGEETEVTIPAALAWWQAWPYLAARGFKCGPDSMANKSHWDLWHCDDRAEETSPAQKVDAWKRCGKKPDLCPPDWQKHRWQGEISEVRDFFKARREAEEAARKAREQRQQQRGKKQKGRRKG